MGVLKAKVGGAWVPVGVGLPSVGAWIPVTFLNGFSDVGGTRPASAYRFVGDMVQLRLACKGGNTGVSITTLPVGFRPTATLDIVGRDAASPVTFNLLADGSIIWYGASSANNTLVVLHCQFATV